MWEQEVSQWQEIESDTECGLGYTLFFILREEMPVDLDLCFFVPATKIQWSVGCCQTLFMAVVGSISITPP